MGRWRGWLAAYRAGDFVERHCHLRGDGDGCAVRRRVLSLGRLAGVSVNHYGRGAGGHFVGDPASASKGKPLPFRAVLGRVWLYGMALALASAGFGVIATFITLFYDAKGWDGAAFALTLFSCAFVGTRLLFPNGINRIGGLNVAMICFSVEIIGLLLVGVATMPWMAKIGVLLAGAGFSLVFPALGVVAVKAVPQQNQGAALATYTVFMDLSLGVTGPLAGLVMSWAGVPVIYLAAAGLVAIALLLTWRLKKRPPEHVPEAASSS